MVLSARATWHAYAHGLGVGDADEEGLARLAGEGPPATVHNRARHEQGHRLILSLHR